MAFENLLGNDRLKKNLTESLARGHISHFYPIILPKKGGRCIPQRPPLKNLPSANFHLIERERGSKTASLTLSLPGVRLVLCELFCTGRRQFSQRITNLLLYS